MALRILIVDDERLARLRLAGLVAEWAKDFRHGEPLVSEADSTQAALDALQHSEFDLVLLDIRMPGRDGLQLAAQLQVMPRRPQIVFVTAQPQHALRAFELEATDYLTKPVTRERLHKALTRVARISSSAPEHDSAQPQDLIINERGRVLRIPIGEVLYFKAGDKYVTARTAEESHLLEQSLADLESRLGDRFVRVHRNAVVARRSIAELGRAGREDEESAGWAVRVEPTGEWVAVSRRMLGPVRDALAELIETDKREN
jgi:two-component system response regulator AlgR